MALALAPLAVVEDARPRPRLRRPIRLAPGTTRKRQKVTGKSNSIDFEQTYLTNKKLALDTGYYTHTAAEVASIPSISADYGYGAGFSPYYPAAVPSSSGPMGAPAASGSTGKRVGPMGAPAASGFTGKRGTGGGPQQYKPNREKIVLL
jgi:hypothetical protein